MLGRKKERKKAGGGMLFHGLFQPWKFKDLKLNPAIKFIAE